MKISVLGSGAVGSMFGGLIKHYAPDLDVILIGRGAHGEAMRRQGGVALKGKWGKFFVQLNVSESVAHIADSDYLLLTVKSNSTEQAIREAIDHLAPTTTVISIQNGINQPVLLEYVAADRLVMGMTATKIAMKEPGTISMERNAATVVGPSCNSMPRERVEASANLLRRSKLKITTESRIIGSQYNKLVFNTLGAAASLSNLDFLGGALLDPRWRKKIAIPLQQESLYVLKQAGLQLNRIPGMADAYRFARLMRWLDWPLLGPTATAILRAANRRPVRFSLAVDLAQGKKTEVDFMNGEIVRLAEENQIRAPLNKRIVSLVHELEQREGFLAPELVIDVFAGS